MPLFCTPSHTFQLISMALTLSKPSNQSKLIKNGMYGVDQAQPKMHSTNSHYPYSNQPIYIPSSLCPFYISPTTKMVEYQVRSEHLCLQISLKYFLLIIFIVGSMNAQENEHRRYRGYKIDSQVRGLKDSSLGYTMQQIRTHCQRVTARHPEQQANCINLNCAAQKYYIDCFETLKDRKECIRNLRFEVEQNGHYRLSHLKTD